MKGGDKSGRMITKVSWGGIRECVRVSIFQRVETPNTPKSLYCACTVLCDGWTDQTTDIKSCRVMNVRSKLYKIFFSLGHELPWTSRLSCRACPPCVITHRHVPPCTTSCNAPPYTSAYHEPPCSTMHHQAPPHRTPSAVQPNVERPAERCFELIGKRKLLKNLIRLSTRA